MVTDRHALNHNLKPSSSILDIILILALFLLLWPQPFQKGRKKWGYNSYDSLNGLHLAVFCSFFFLAVFSRLGCFTVCVWLLCVGVALWPELHCSSAAMDSGPERKPTHSQEAMIPLGYKPNHLSYKSTWFVPQYHPHLCIPWSSGAAQFVQMSHRHAKDNHGEQIIKC